MIGKPHGIMRSILSGSGEHRLSSDVTRLAVVAVLYWLTARLGLNFALVHGQVTPIWPPTGIALVAILVVGRRVWPAIALAAFAVNLPIGPSPLGAALIAAGNTLAPLVSAQLLSWAGFRLELDRLRDAMAITLLAALGGMSISATVGSSVLLFSGSIVPSSFWPTWAVWWAGDAMGVLLVAPFLLSLLPRPSLPALTWRRAAELAGLLVATAIVTDLLFQNPLQLEYLVFPLIMVAAWRFRLRGAAPAALIASGVAVWSAVHGTGPFATETLVQKMVTLQVFNVCVALASFVLASFVDTRERAQEITRRYVTAQAANEAKSNFLNMAAHELRTPITVLTGYLSMLSEGSLGRTPEKWAKPLAILIAKTRELDKLVTDLLQASRLEADIPPQRLTQVDLRTVAAEAVERARPRAGLLGAAISLDLAAHPVLAEADPEQIGRILDNLINNGLTYTARSPRLSVAVSSDQERALMRVADNGVGVPVDQHERIFERFHRTNDPAFVNVPGTGLGLYISRQLAAGHGGSLMIEGSEDVGTVFVLAVPLMKAKSGEVAAPDSELATGAPTQELDAAG